MHLLLETFTNGFTYYVLNAISFSSVVCGILVITSKNPIVSVLFLIGLFLSVASYLMILGLNFIGLSYLLVYVGAVSILFLFILMLINVRISELVTDNNNSLFLAIMIGIIFNLTLYRLIPSNSSKDTYINTMDTATTLKKVYENNPVYHTSIKNDLSYVSSQIWDSALAETSHITSIGNVIYTVYPLWLIITSIILLLAMVGAIVITIKQ